MSPRERSDSTLDVLGAGSLALDELLHVSRYPSGDTKTPVREHRVSLGGLSAQALVAAARLGASTAYAGVLGEGEDSRLARSLLVEEGIETRWIQDVPGARPIHSWIIIAEEPASRNVFFDLEGARGISRLDPDLVRSCRVLLVDQHGLEGMVTAAEIAREAGIPVVADLDGHPRGIEQLVDRADHLIVSREFAAKFTGHEDPRQAGPALLQADREAVVITRGEEGFDWWTPDEPGGQHAGAFEVQALNTTGCGDVFHGAYAFGLARGLELSARLELASATAALRASRRGGHEAVPRREEVVEFLRERGRAPSWLDALR